MVDLEWHRALTFGANHGCVTVMGLDEDLNFMNASVGICAFELPLVPTRQPDRTGGGWPRVCVRAFA